jgi:hypothetical protein
VLCVQVLLMAWAPESPVYLESIGSKGAADAAYLRLWGERALLPPPEEPLEHATGAGRGGAGAAATHGSLRQPLLRRPSPSAAAGSSSTPGGSPSSRRQLQPPGGPRALLPPRQHQHVQQQQQQQQHEPSRVLDAPLYAAGAAGSAGSGYGCSSAAAAAAAARALSGASGSSGAARALLGASGSGGAAAGLAAGGGWEQLLQRRYRWMMVLALGLPLLQQASGVNTVVYYSSQVCVCMGGWAAHWSHGLQETCAGLCPVAWRQCARQRAPIAATVDAAASHARHTLLRAPWKRRRRCLLPRGCARPLPLPSSRAASTWL